RYASVLPPPVGNQITSTTSLDADSGLTSDSRVPRKKATWNGRHLKPWPVARTGVSRPSPRWYGPCRAACAICICHSMAWFASWKALNVVGSDRQEIPASIRCCQSRHREDNETPTCSPLLLATCSCASIQRENSSANLERTERTSRASSQKARKSRSL